MSHREVQKQLASVVTPPPTNSFLSTVLTYLPLVVSIVAIGIAIFIYLGLNNKFNIIKEQYSGITDALIKSKQEREQQIAKIKEHHAQQQAEEQMRSMLGQSSVREEPSANKEPMNIFGGFANMMGIQQSRPPPKKNDTVIEEVGETEEDSDETDDDEPKKSSRVSKESSEEPLEVPKPTQFPDLPQKPASKTSQAPQAPEPKKTVPTKVKKDN